MHGPRLLNCAPHERLERFPRGLIVLGDAMCSLNPVYGQGMTVAAKEVEHFDQCFQQCIRTGGNLDNFALPFFKGAANIVDVAWNGVTVEDFKYPQTRGERPRGYAIARWMNDRFFALSGVDEEFAVAFNKVLHLAAPPSSILKSKCLFKAIFNGKRQAADYYP